MVDLDQSQSLEASTLSHEPWLIKEPEKFEILKHIETQYKPLNWHGIKVGIGVATGADSVFIAHESLAIEADRKLPLVMSSHLTEDGINYDGKIVINPYFPDGSLIDLAAYPKLADYFQLNAYQLKARHYAKRNPSRWYATIDKIKPELLYQEKLLIPDIDIGNKITIEQGVLYPHHNLYYMVSQHWPLEALKAVLASPLGDLFVSSYSSGMRGGYYRYQAHILRRVCLPDWGSLTRDIQIELLAAFKMKRTIDKELLSEIYQVNFP